MLARRLIILGGKPTISFPSTAILASATGGTAVGTATIRGKVKGTAFWSLADSAGGKYAINSSTGAVTVNGALSAGTDSITIAVSGLTPAVKNATFSIGVVSAPVNSVAPAITGTSAVGFTLSCSTGTWSNNAYNTYSYQWKMDGSNVGTNSPTYVPVSGDTGKIPTCVVTATNIAGNANATSNSASAVLGTPTNSVLPAISGSASPGQTVSVSNGTWTSSPTGYTYQWKLDGSSIVGATSSSYLIQAGDDTHTLTCTVTASNIVGSASATSIGVVVSTFPSGALGIWYADTFVSSPRPQILNAQSVNAASPNLLTSSRRMFSNTEWWGTYGAGTVSATDDAATGPDGLTQASTITATGGWYLAPQNVLSGGNFAAGTYTVACSVKRNDVTDQPFAFTVDNTASRDVHTATSSWQRFSFTFVKGSTWTPQIVGLCSSDGSTGAKLQICDLELFAGSSDLGPVALSGHLLLGSFAGDSRPTYSSGALDLATNSGYGLIQFLNSTTISSTGITMVALVSKTATNNWDGIISKVQSYFDFTGAAGINGIPVDFTTGAMPSSGGAAGLWDLKTLGGYHGITHRYDGTNRDLFIDDVRIWRKVSSVSDFTIRDFFCGIVNTIALPCGLKISGIALWNRSLSDSEVRTAVAALQARATGNGLTATSVSRVLVAEGDSITALTSPTSYAYKFGPNSSPFLIGAVYAVSGSTLADVNTRTAITDGIVPPSTAGRKFIFSCLLGANDLQGSPPSGYASVSAWASAYATMFAGRKALGYTTVGITTLPSTSGSINTNRAVGNPIIIAMQGTQTDATADFGGDSVMGPDAAASDTNLYSDGKHPTDTGMSDLEFQSGHTTTTYRPVINGV